MLELSKCAQNTSENPEDFERTVCIKWRLSRSRREVTWVRKVRPPAIIDNGKKAAGVGALRRARRAEHSLLGSVHPCEGADINNPTSFAHTTSQPSDFLVQNTRQ